MRRQNSGSKDEISLEYNWKGAQLFGLSRIDAYIKTLVSRDCDLVIPYSESKLFRRQSENSAKAVDPKRQIGRHCRNGQWKLPV